VDPGGKGRVLRNHQREAIPGLADGQNLQEWDVEVGARGDGQKHRLDVGENVEESHEVLREIMRGMRKRRRRRRGGE